MKKKLIFIISLIILGSLNSCSPASNEMKETDTIIIQQDHVLYEVKIDNNGIVTSYPIEKKESYIANSSANEKFSESNGKYIFNFNNGNQIVVNNIGDNQTTEIKLINNKKTITTIKGNLILIDIIDSQLIFQGLIETPLGDGWETYFLKEDGTTDLIIPNDNKIRDVFRIYTNRTTTIDVCSNIKEYSNEAWYSALESIIFENQIDIEKIMEACYSSNNKMLIFLIEGEYGSLGSVYRYFTANQSLEIAQINDHERGFLASAEEFGNIQNQVIEIIAGGGDAGCMLKMYFDYDYQTNTVELKKEFGICEGEKEGHWTEY